MKLKIINLWCNFRYNVDNLEFDKVIEIRERESFTDKHDKLTNIPELFGFEMWFVDF